MEAALIFRLSLTFTSNRCYNRSLTDVVPQILQCFLRVWRADISVLSQVRILYVNEKEKRYKRNIMFLFAGHSDKPLKSLISMAHEGNHICLHRFSFIYVMDDLREGAYGCPSTTYKSTTKSATLHPSICNLLFFFTQLPVYGLCVIIRCTFFYDVIDLPYPGDRFL